LDPGPDLTMCDARLSVRAKRPGDVLVTAAASDDAASAAAASLDAASLMVRPA